MRSTYTIAHSQQPTNPHETSPHQEVWNPYEVLVGGAAHHIDRPLPTCLSICLPICLSTHLPVSLSTRLSVYLSTCLSVATYHTVNQLDTMLKGFTQCIHHLIPTQDSRQQKTDRQTAQTDRQG